MARKTIIVCDICESGQGVKAWEVKNLDPNDVTKTKVRVELCITHSQPLARLFEDKADVAEAADVPAPRARRRGTVPVVRD